MHCDVPKPAGVTPDKVSLISQYSKRFCRCTVQSTEFHGTAKGRARFSASAKRLTCF